MTQEQLTDLREQRERLAQQLKELSKRCTYRGLGD